MKVKDVMTREVKSISPAAPLKEIAETLSGLGISGAPVVEAGKVVGVVSEADIVVKERGRRPERGGLLAHLRDGGDRVKQGAKTAGQAMTSPAITITPDRPIAEAAAKMLDEGVNRLPVVDRDGALVGIVTRADLVRAFVRTDEEIAEEIREDVLLNTLWIRPGNVTVEVESGEVTLTGWVDTKVEAEIVAAFVEKVPGVVSVTSDLTWEIEEGKESGRGIWVRQT